MPPKLTKIAADLDFWPKALNRDLITLINREMDRVIAKNSDTDNLRRAYLNSSTITHLAAHKTVTALAEKRLGGEPKLARATFFCKSASSNWHVPWHQDSVVAVSERFEAPGWRNWRQKGQVYYSEAPADVLAQTVTFRFHLSASTRENGCLYVLPDTARLGPMPAREIHDHAQATQAHKCLAAPGDCLIMSPLTIHRSKRSVDGSERRVLHLEYSSAPLPDGVEWAG